LRRVKPWPFLKTQSILTHVDFLSPFQNWGRGLDTVANAFKRYRASFRAFMTCHQDAAFVLDARKQNQSVRKMYRN